MSFLPLGDDVVDKVGGHQPDKPNNGFQRTGGGCSTGRLTAPSRR